METTTVVNPNRDPIREDLDKDPEVQKVEHVVLAQLPLPDRLAHLNAEEVKDLEKDLVKRLDCFLLPAVFILFLLNILDRNNIANAKIAGLPETLHISNDQYNTCLMIFYVGYVLTQLPSNVIIGKLRPSYYIGFVTSGWGIVSMCQAFTHNFAGLLVSRFILGLIEGPFLPGTFFLMSCWYKRTELPPRIAILYGANMLASAFGGLIAAGIVARMDGKLGRPAWEWLFIIEGSMTIAIALLVIPLIPDYPMFTKRWWLKEEHQVLADYRLRNENAGIEDDDPESLWKGAKQAIRDPKLYMFIVLQMSLITAQSFNNFFPSIVETLGYDDTITLLLTAPPYFFAFICSLSISFHAAKQNERGWHIVIPMVFAVVGNIMAMTVPNLGARYFSMFLMTAGSYSPYNLCVSWVSSTLPRPKAKRAAALAIINLMGAGVAHFYTSYMFPDSQQPRYYAGGSVMSGAALVCGLMAIWIKYFLKKENRKIEMAEIGGAEEAAGVIGASARSGQAVRFRYVH